MRKNSAFGADFRRRIYEGSAESTDYHRASSDGTVELSIDQKQRRLVVASLAAAMCGAFDVAGEHEQEVMNTLRLVAAESAILGGPDEDMPAVSIH